MDNKEQNFSLSDSMQKIVHDIQYMSENKMKRKKEIAIIFFCPEMEIIANEILELSHGAIELEHIHLI